MRIKWLPLALALAADLPAERYAVLAGVGNYPQPGVSKLEGPAYDIQAVRERLLQSGYQPQTVVALVDAEATRSNVLGSLSAAVAKLRAGDHLLFYFSGHGTSAYGLESETLRAAIGPDSGALIPTDLGMSSYQQMASGLIIGRRDLRPILSRVPAGAQALVILDACYSENSVKSVGSFAKATARGVQLVKEPATRASGAPSSAPHSSTTAEDYPYSNVVALAAASKDQKALDIGAAMLRDHPTVDGKPHGVLTNSLLRALAGQADTNRDGQVSYDELFRFVRRDMEGVPHQPQLLSNANFPLQQPALGVTNRPPPDPAPAPAPPAKTARQGVRLVVLVESGDPSLEQALTQVSDIALARSGPYELLIRREETTYALYDSGGALVQRLASIPEVVARAQTQSRLKVLRNWHNPAQTFNVLLDAEPANAKGYDRLRSTFAIGDTVRLRIASEQPAYLLLLSINKQGRISVLFPGPDDSEQAIQTPRKPVVFDVSATRPAGVEHLKLIGFRERPENWQQWFCRKSCPEFGAADPQMSQLRRLLQPAAGVAEAGLRVITVE
ncbi:MAG: caspase family protein [Bryobacterales bacterium]|nr:caspase family protein [Bryobacterales bacterium]